MEEAKRKKLEDKGWKVGTVSEFLDLTPEETTLIEIKLAISRYLKKTATKINDSNRTSRQITLKSTEDC